MFGPRLCQRVHVLPFGDDAIAALAGLDDVDVLEARPVGLNLLVGVEEFLIAPGLHPEAHGVEGGHRKLPMSNGR
jgi:hypothetical protein